MKEVRLKPKDDSDWFSHARYGKGGSEYKRICAEAHELTDRFCTLCNRPSKYFHHALYWAGWKWLVDIYRLYRDKEVDAPWWMPPGRRKKQQKFGGLTQGAEMHGISCFVLCEHCHPCGDIGMKNRGIVHSHEHWIEHKKRTVAVWHNRNKFWMLQWLRLNWIWKRECRGLTNHHWTWRLLVKVSLMLWWVAGRIIHGQIR